MYLVIVGPEVSIGCPYSHTCLLGHRCPHLTKENLRAGLCQAGAIDVATRNPSYLLGVPHPCLEAGHGAWAGNALEPKSCLGSVPWHPSREGSLVGGARTQWAGQAGDGLFSGPCLITL